MASPSEWKEWHRVTPRPFRARVGGLIFALVVVLVAIWMLSRFQ